MSGRLADERDDAADAIDALLVRLTEADHATPDLSRSIMGRLGYMRIAAPVSRRRTLAKWGNRAAMFMIVAIAFTLGWRVFSVSDQVRRPSDMTIPQAVGRDVEMQRQRLDSLIQTIRSISSPKLEAPPTTTGEESDGFDRPRRGRHAPREMRDDVNRATYAAVRWV